MEDHGRIMGGSLEHLNIEIIKIYASFPLNFKFMIRYLKVLLTAKNAKFARRFKIYLSKDTVHRKSFEI
jgi:hypothetical protein